MATSFRHLPVAVLEHCLKYLDKKTLSQSSLVSKYLNDATRYAIFKPKHVDCRYMDLRQLSLFLQQVTNLRQVTGNRDDVPLISSLEFRLAENMITKYDAARVRTVIQIMKVSRGVSKFILEVGLTGIAFNVMEHVIPSIREMAAAAAAASSAQSTDAHKVELIIVDSRRKDVSKLDQKVSAILEAFRESPLDALVLSGLPLHDLRRCLIDGLVRSSLRVLQVYECSFSVNNPLDVLTLPRLEDLNVISGDVPFNVVKWSALSLFKLRIVNPTSNFMPDARLLRASFPNLHTFTLQDDSSKADPITNTFLINDHMQMPSLQTISANVDDLFAYSDSLLKVLDRHPLVKKLTVKEGLYGHRALNFEGVDMERAAYFSLMRLCAERQVSVTMTCSSRTCSNAAELAEIMNRLRSCQSFISSCGLGFMIGALNEADFAFDEPLHLSKLTTFSLGIWKKPRTLVALGEDEVANGKALLSGLKRLILRISAPRCESLNLRIAIHLSLAKPFIGLLEELLAGPSFPRVGCIDGTLSISIGGVMWLTERANNALDQDYDPCSAPRQELVQAILEMQERTGIDCSKWTVAVDI